MAKFTDYDFAIRFRNVISRVVDEILDRDRPPDKIGRVVDVDRASGFASVVFSGDQGNPVRVKMYPGIQPTRSDRVNGEGNGSICRVSGPPGGRYIAQVMDGGFHQVAPRLVSPVISAGGSGDNSIRTLLSFNAPTVPVFGEAPQDIVALFVPTNTCIIESYIELTGAVDGECYVQKDRIAVDNLSTRYSQQDGVKLYGSSTGVDILTSFLLFDFDDTFATTRLEVMIKEGPNSTRTGFTNMKVHLDIFGTNVEVIELLEGTT